MLTILKKVGTRKLPGKVVDGRLIGTVFQIDVWIYYGVSGDKWMRLIDFYNGRMDLPLNKGMDFINLITQAINTEGNSAVCPVCGRQLKETLFGEFICDTHQKIDVPVWEKHVPRNRDD